MIYHRQFFFNTWFSFSSGQHICYKTNKYGKYSSTVKSWKKIQKQLKNTLFKDLSLNEIMTVFQEFLS